MEPGLQGSLSSEAIHLPTVAALVGQSPKVAGCCSAFFFFFFVRVNGKAKSSYFSRLSTGSFFKTNSVWDSTWATNGITMVVALCESCSF